MNDFIPGIVVAKNDVKENDEILKVCCKEQGIVSFYGKGLKKSTSKNAYACQLFDLSEFNCDYSDSRSVQLLKSATLKNDFHGIKGDYDKLALGSVMLEIIAQLEQEDLFDVLLAGLQLLEKSPEPYMVYGLFVVRILDYLGISPAVDGCVVCGSQKNIETISLADGGFICHDCNRQYHSKPLDADFMRRFRIICKASYEVHDRIVAMNLNDYELAKYLTEFLAMHSGLHVRSFRSVNY